MRRLSDKVLSYTKSFEKQRKVTNVPNVLSTNISQPRLVQGNARPERAGRGGSESHGFGPRCSPKVTRGCVLTRGPGTPPALSAPSGISRVKLARRSTGGVCLRGTCDWTDSPDPSPQNPGKSGSSRMQSLLILISTFLSYL